MKKLINLTGQASPHLSRKITYLMMLLVSLIWSTGTAWAEGEVVYKNDFTNGQAIWLTTANVDAAKTAGWITCTLKEGTSEGTTTFNVSVENAPDGKNTYSSSKMTGYNAKQKTARSYTYHVTGVEKIRFYIYNRSSSTASNITAEWGTSSTAKVESLNSKAYTTLDVELEKTSNNDVVLFCENNDFVVYGLVAFTGAEPVKPAKPAITASDPAVSAVGEGSVDYQASTPERYSLTVTSDANVTYWTKANSALDNPGTWGTGTWTERSSGDISGTINGDRTISIVAVSNETGLASDVLSINYTYIPSYTVSYVLNGHGESIDDATKLTALPATLPTPTEVGYDFAGWYLDDVLTNVAIAGAAISANTTLYAKWTAKQYNIKYRETDDQTISGVVPAQHTYGTETILGTPVKDGYTFEGWYTNHDLTGDPITVLGATDYTSQPTVYAKWTKNKESITFTGTWYGKQSTRHKLDAGESMHVTFHNTSNGTASYNNWILSAGTDAENNHAYMSLRADVYNNNGTDGDNTTRILLQNGESLSDWSTFNADMEAGADVDIRVANSGSRLYVHAVTTAASGNVYTYTAETKEQTHPEVYIALMGEQCTLTDIEFSEPATAYSVNASAGTDCSSVEITNELNMQVSNGTYVPSGEKITFTATPEAGKVFKSWNADESPVSENNPSTLDVTFDVNVEAVCGEPEVTEATVSSVMVAGKEYISTLADKVITASNYYGAPTIVVTLSDDTHPVVSKTNGNSMGNRTATFTVGADTYTIKYKQQNVSTKDLTVLSDKDATTWNFKTSLTRPSYIIGDWTWNNMTITSSEENQIGLDNGGIINYTGSKAVHTFSIKVPGPGTLTINGHAKGTRYFDVENANGDVVSTVTMNTTSNHDWTADYNGPATTLTFSLRSSEVLRIEYIKWTPAQPIASIEIPSAVTVHVGEVYRFADHITLKDAQDATVTSDALKNFTAAWTITNNSSNIEFNNKTKVNGIVTGLKSNPSDNATVTVKLAVAGIESNECIVTIARTPLAVRADHIALSHNGNASRTLNAVAYNPYTREVVSSNVELTAAKKEGSSAFATSTGNTITPMDNSAIGTETWTVTATPKSGKTEANLYAPGTADIQVTCRDYLYAYDTGTPSTVPVARPVENASHDVALNYYAGQNPAECKKDAGSEPYAAWGTANRRPQTESLTYVQSGKKPYARINAWDGIMNVAEPTMNSLSEQHSRSGKYGDDSNGTFTYNRYNYYGDHDEFNVPVMGSFYRFYPEKNGTLVAYLCVNGQFSDSQMNDLVTTAGFKTGYASRNTYFLDPYANSMEIQNATVQPTSTIQPGFFHYTLENCTGLDNFKRDVVELLNHWAAWGNDEKDANGNLIIPVKNGYSEGKTNYTIDNVDWVKFKKLGEDKVGIFHQPIANIDGSFRVITKTYVRCEIPVEKGRVYYVSPTGTKTRMAGVEFVPANDPVATDVNFYNGKLPVGGGNTSDYVLPNEANQSTGFQNSVTMTNGNYYNVTLADRTFKPGQWYSFCMPFDVPQKQIHDIFGADAVTIHFDHVSGDGDDLEMNFWSHFYDQIRAGRPIMIKMPDEFPNNTGMDQKTLTDGNLTNVKFKHVKYNPVDASELFISDDNGWVFKGSYTPVAMEKNAVILNGSNFYHYKNVKKTLAGNRAWIQGPAEGAPKNLSTSFHFFNEEDEDAATGIEEILSEMGINVVKSSNKIFNLNGQMVGKGADINNLPKGVYIINGKKQIIK